MREDFTKTEGLEDEEPDRMVADAVAVRMLSADGVSGDDANRRAASIKRLVGEVRRLQADTRLGRREAEQELK